MITQYRFFSEEHELCLTVPGQKKYRTTLCTKFILSRVPAAYGNVIFPTIRNVRPQTDTIPCMHKIRYVQSGKIQNADCSFFGLSGHANRIQIISIFSVYCDIKYIIKTDSIGCMKR
jgi:hypothetical protein